jgi:hypothetical protein
MIANLTASSGIQMAAVLLSFPVYELIDQPCIGLACASLVNQLKTGPAITLLT